MTTIPSLTPRLWLQLLLLSVLWGGSFFFIEIALTGLQPLTLVAARVTLAATALWGLLWLRGTPFPTGRVAWLAFLAMGLINNALPFTLITWGQTHITGALASILNATTPLFTVFLAHVLTHDEKLSGHRLAGVTIGFVGAVVMVGAGALGGMGGHTLAELAILGAALSYAFAGIFGRRFGRLGYSPLATATGQLTASSLIMIPIALAVDRPWSQPGPTPGAVAAVVILALACSALAYILYFRVLRGAGATNLLLVTFLIPVSAIVLGGVFLGETIEAQHWVGMALIGGGLVIMDGRVLRRAGTG